MSKLPTVRSCMDPGHHAVGEEEDILDAVRMLIREGVTGAPVINERGNVTGALGENQCLRLLTKGVGQTGPAGKVADYMDRNFQTVTQDMDIYYVAGLFLGAKHRRFAVVGNDKLVGVVTRKDVLRAVERNLPKPQP